MKKTLLIALVMCVFLGTINAQQTNPWEVAKDTSFTLAKKQISSKNLYKLNLELLKTELTSTAKRDVSMKTSAKKIIYFPVSNGDFLAFEVTELSTLAPALAEKYPDIKSYEGVATNNPLNKIRFSIDVFGFHGMLLGNDIPAYINPTAFGSDVYYLASKSEFEPTPFECGVIDENPIEETNTGNKPSTVIDGQLRTFRLALACTAEYSTYHINKAGVAAQPDNIKKAAVLSAMNTTMTRVNGVFERDLSITMQIIPNNDLLIFLDPTTDGYTNNNGSIMLDENQTIIDNAIGTANYDIGHVFSTGGGGVAGIRTPCALDKAYGVTGLPNPIDDAFSIDYVCHEMGHQYGAEHTHNNVCNRNDSTAVEPGSGSTIMAYAGVCSPNVQNKSDAYFHAVSIAEMYLNITTRNSTCANKKLTGNLEPIVDAGIDYTIPKGTAFVLEGTATDANTGPVDILTYTWEQLDTEVATMPPLANSVNGPAFRSIFPSTSPKRYFPKTSDILANNLTPTWEVVSNAGRKYNFSLLARDNRSGGGQTGRDNAVVTSINTAGPFVVTSQTTASTLVAGNVIMVTWDVANTNLAPINTNEVDIYLIINDNFENLVSVTQDTPNDGSANVIVPGGITSNNVRIMVKANNNIYFDINNAVLRIQSGNFSLRVNKLEYEVCQPNNLNFNFIYLKFNGFNETMTFTASSVPAGLNVTFNPPTTSANNTTVQVLVTGTGALPEGSNSFIIQATSPSSNKQYPIDILVDSNIFPALALTEPTNNATAIDFKPTFTWGNIAKAEQYIFQLSTTNTFSSILETKTTHLTSYALQTILNPETQYFWRVKPLNLCGEGSFSSIYSFITNTMTCSNYLNNTVKPISTSGTPVVTSTINIAAQGSLRDITVDVELTHTNINNLLIELISPKGTVISLINRPCSGHDDLNATFSDAGVNFACLNTPPAVSGIVKPKVALSNLLGESVTGNWTLRVSDKANLNGGQLVKFGLKLCAPTAPTLGLLDNSFSSSLNLYPNPFSTIINLQSPNINGKTKVEVYTLTGVKVYGETINPKTNGEISVNLETLPSGTYLMTIENNDKKTVEKIIKL